MEPVVKVLLRVLGFPVSLVRWASAYWLDWQRLQDARAAAGIETVRQLYDDVITSAEARGDTREANRQRKQKERALQQFREAKEREVMKILNRGGRRGRKGG